MNCLPLNRPLIDRLRATLSLSLLVAGCLFAGCATPEPVDEGVNPPIALAIDSFQTRHSTKLETSHGPITRLYPRDTVVIGYTADGTAYVLERATLKFLHAETIRHGEQVLHPPVVLKDFIVYPTNTSLEIYDKAGSLIRSKDLGYNIRSDAVGTRTYVFLGADFVAGGRLVAVDVTSEYLDHKWELMFPKAGVRAAPAIFNDIVYAAGDNGDVAAVAFDTREPIWPIKNSVFHTYGPITADLGVDEVGLYVASADTKLCCLNRNNGHVKWQYESNAELREAPIVVRDKDLVFQHVPNVGFVAIDKGPGPFNRMPRWTAPDIDTILSVDERYVYAVRDDKMIVALDKHDGHVAFTSRRHDIMTYSTNTVDGTIYAVTTANRILAIGSVLKPGVVGELAWHPATPQDARVALSGQKFEFRHSNFPPPLHRFNSAHTIFPPLFGLKFPLPTMIAPVAPL